MRRRGKSTDDEARRAQLEREAAAEMQRAMGPAAGSPAPSRYTREVEPGEPEAPYAGRGVAEGAPRVLRRQPRPPDAAARRAQVEAEAAAELERAAGSPAEPWRDLGAAQRPPSRFTRRVEPEEPEEPEEPAGRGEAGPSVQSRRPRLPDAAARRAQLEAEAAAELQRATGSPAQSWRDLGAVQRPPSRFTRRVEPEEPEEPEEPAVERQRPTAARSPMRPQSRPQPEPPPPPRSAATRQVEAEYDEEDEEEDEYDYEYEYGEYDDEPIPLLGVAGDFDATGVALRQLAERSSSVRPEDIVMRIDAVEAQATRDRAMAEFLERQARQREAMQRSGAGIPVKRVAPAMPAMPVTPGLVARAGPSSPAPVLPATTGRAAPAKTAKAPPAKTAKAPPAKNAKAPAAKTAKALPAKTAKAPASKSAKAPASKSAKAPASKTNKATGSKAAKAGPATAVTATEAASASRPAAGKPARAAVGKPARAATPGPAARTPRSSASKPETSAGALGNGTRQGSSKRAPRRPAAGG